MEWVALTLAVGAAVAGGFSLWGLKTISAPAQLKTLCMALMEEIEAQKSAIASVRRDFRTLEEDVDAHLEQASTRAARARGRESSEKRKARVGPPNGQQQMNMDPGADLEAAFQAAEASLWDS